MKCVFRVSCYFLARKTVIQDDFFIQVKLLTSRFTLLCSINFNRKKYPIHCLARPCQVENTIGKYMALKVEISKNFQYGISS